MKKQYKNPFENPDAKFWDKKVKDYKIPKRVLKEKIKHAATPHGYIYVPKIKLYVAKEKSLYNLSWEDSHKELHKKSMQMLTIRQFIDFILYLQKNPSIPDAKKILDEILTIRNPWREEWLDAKFSRGRLRGGIPIKAMSYLGGSSFFWPGDDDEPIEKAGKLYIHYNHRTENGKLVAKNKEPLEKCLMKDNCYIDLKSCNRQGLPTREGKDISYFPTKEGRRIAMFSADSLRRCLNCDWDADGRPTLGVRPAFKKEEKK